MASYRGCMSSFKISKAEIEAQELTAAITNANSCCRLPVSIHYRTSENDFDILRQVFYWDCTPFNKVFQNGIKACNRCYNLSDYVNDKDTGFVSTTISNSWSPDLPYDRRRPDKEVEYYRYEIFAPGGIWVKLSLGELDSRDPERYDDVAFVQGIAPQYIRSAQLFKLKANRDSSTTIKRVNNELIINRNFNPQSYPFKLLKLELPICDYINGENVREALQLKFYPESGYGKEPERGWRQEPERGCSPEPERGWRQKPERGCSPEPERGWRQKPERGCSPEPERGWRQKPERGCSPEPERGWRQKPERGYSPEPERGWRQKPERGCSPEPERGWRQKPERGCSPEPERGCRQEPERGCGKEPQLSSNDDALKWYSQGVTDILSYLSASFRSSTQDEAYYIQKKRVAYVNYDPSGNADKILEGPFFWYDMFEGLKNTPFGHHGVDCSFASHKPYEAYLFCGNLCTLINYGKDDGELLVPKTIASMFPFLEGTIFEHGIDAAFEATTKYEAFFFKGDKCATVKYRGSDAGIISIDAIAKVFPSLKGKVHEEGVDATHASHLINEVYLFHHNTFAQINYVTNEVIYYDPVGSQGLGIASLFPLKNRGVDLGTDSDTPPKA